MWGGFQAVEARADGVFLGIYGYPDEDNAFNTATCRDPEDSKGEEQVMGRGG